MLITVRLDDNLRLAGALLAAGTWPEWEQKQKPYKPHRVAEGARKYFAPYRMHPAVLRAQALAGNGEGVPELLGQALESAWPGSLGTELADFVAAARPQDFWAETDADWQAAIHELGEVLARADLGQFLADFFGPPTCPLALAPNLLFPGQRCLAWTASEALLVYAPPPLAWGTSPPWRYNERPDEVLAMVCQAYAGVLFAQHLPGLAAVKVTAGAEALALAAAVLFLRQAEGDAAGDQFMVIQKKVRGWRGLPGVVSALAALLAARRAGTGAALADGLPELTGLLEQLT